MLKFKKINQIYWRNVTVMIFITLSSLTFAKLYQDNLVMPKLIQQPAGHDAELHCGIHENHATFMNQSIVFWDFKKCSTNSNGYYSNRNPCRNYHQNHHHHHHQHHQHNFQHNQQQQLIPTQPNKDKNDTINQNLTSSGDDEWTRILCNQKPCRALLLIKNATEQDSGLYRCSIQPYRPNDQTTLQIQVVKTYQLHVINTTIAVPELLDNLPANQTAIMGSQVVLQCRVHSKVSPTIKWFRRKQHNRFNEKNEDSDSGTSSITNVNNSGDDENSHFNSKVIQFLENSYVHLESAGEKGLTENTYLSKLILNGITELDAGFYVCVGINYRGYKYREAYLNVISDDGSGGITLDDYHNIDNDTGNVFSLNDDDDDDDQASDHNMVNKELLLLFLIPLGLAAIPLAMWFCYLFWRWRSHRIEANNCMKDDAIIRQTQQQQQQQQHQHHHHYLGRKYSMVCSNDVYL